MHLAKGIAVVAPLEHGGQAEGVAGKFARGFDGVDGHQHQREQVEHRSHQGQHQQHRAGIALLLHHICTSRLDVK